MTIAEAMWRHVNAWPGRGAPIVLDTPGTRAPGLALRQLSGTVVEKRFVDGRFIGRWPFALVVRVDAEDTQRRLGAVEEIAALGGWLRENFPVLGEGRMCLEVEMTGLPAQAAAYEDGTEDYQAVFALVYKEGLRDG